MEDASAQPDLAWIEPDLAVGSKPYAGQRSSIRSLGVCAVVSLVELTQYEREDWAGLDVVVECYPTRDWTAIPPATFEAVVQAIVRRLERGERVLLHCLAGVNRAPTLAAAVLVRRHGMDLETALKRVRQARPEAAPTPEQVASLRDWLRMMGGPNGAMEPKALDHGHARDQDS